MEKTAAAKYQGHKIYALCKRMGGKFRDISCLTWYSINEKGSFVYGGEILSCVANKMQFERLEEITKGNYCIGRPTAAKFTDRELEKLIK